MADIATSYTLDPIVFNDGTLGDGTDKYWLTSIQGLDGPVIRAPVDLVPFGDGGILHTFLLGPRRIVMDGMILIESSGSQADCMTLRNQMASSLNSALVAAVTNVNTLEWTPAGLGPFTLDVFCEIGLSITYSDNYAVANFNFGLISAAANPSD